MTTLQDDEPTRTQTGLRAAAVPAAVTWPTGRRCGSRADRTEAEDLVQDAALLAYRAFGSFEPGTNFKAWFFRILTNAFYSRHRKEKHEKANLSTEEVPALYLYSRTAEAGLHGPRRRSGLRHHGPARQRAGERGARGAARRSTGWWRRCTSSRTSPTSRSPRCWSVRWGRCARDCTGGGGLLQKALWEVAVERGVIRAGAPH